MYETFFKLRHWPFSETLEAGAFVTLPGREAILRRLLYGLEYGSGVVLMFGPPGSGKTMLALRLASLRAGPCVHVTFPSMPAPELIAFLADELGGGNELANGSGMAHELRRLRRLLADRVARGQRVLLIIDEAQLIDDPAAFETMRLLLNFASEGPPDVELLFLGGPDVLLQLPPALSDRLAANCLVGPLTESESRAYVEQRLAQAGATSPLFTADAVTALHRLGDGMPRRLNRLADLSLLIAYSRKQLQADADVVSIAAQDLAGTLRAA